MVAFPARKIIDIRVYNRIDTSKEGVLYHNKDYDKYLTEDYIKRLNIRFNLYDMEQKIYLAKEIEYDDINSEIFNKKVKIIRLETVADSKIVYDYDFNKIWEHI